MPGAEPHGPSPGEGWGRCPGRSLWAFSGGGLGRCARGGAHGPSPGEGWGAVPGADTLVLSGSDLGTPPEIQGMT